MDGNFYQDNTNSTQNSPMVNNTPNKADALAIVSLVMGILAIVLGCCTAYIGAIPGVVGIVCSILSKKNNGKTGIATAGLICSIIGIIVAILITILGLFGLAILNSTDYSSLY